MSRIRSFRNTDIQSICSVWNAHHTELGTNCHIDALRLELFSLAKPYFCPDNLLLAEDSDKNIVGFLHFGPVGNSDQSDSDSAAIGINALCVNPHTDEDRVAAELLSRLHEIAVMQHFRWGTFRPLLPDCAFYLSIGPGDSMASATSNEVRTCNWLAQAGFRPKTPTCLWELDLLGFQPPIDRTQIQIRRAATVNQQLDEPSLPWWRACVLGHTEPTSFQLIHRAERRLLKEVLFWTVSPELQSSAEQVVWLWPFEHCDESEDAMAQEYVTFLVAEALREYQQERIDLVRTASLADDQPCTSILHKLGFHPTHNGMVFSIDFA